MAFIRTIAPAEAEGPVRDMYQQIEGQLGFVPNWARAFSLRPGVRDGWIALDGQKKALAGFDGKPEAELDVPVAVGEHDLVAKVETSDGIAIFDALHRHGIVFDAMFYAFDLLELDGSLSRHRAHSRSGAPWQKHRAASPRPGAPTRWLAAM